MISAIIFISRLILGVIALGAIWFVLDTIHDRNTEMTISSIGLLYAFIFLISRRLQYFGLTVFSFFCAPVRLESPYVRVPRTADHYT